MESVQNDLFGTVIDFLKGSFLGNILMVIVVLLILLAPVIKFVHKEWKESKNEKAQKEEEEKKRREQELEDRAKEIARNEQWRNNIEKNFESIDQLSKEMSNIEKELEQVKSIRTELSNDLRQSMEDLNTRMDADKNDSDKQDAVLKENIANIGDKVAEVTDKVHAVAEATQTVQNNLGILFEGENNEFRVYITQIHEKYMGDVKVPIPRDVKAQLRVRYDMYKKRGGNGWAELMYNEIMNYGAENSSHKDN